MGELSTVTQEDLTEAVNQILAGVTAVSSMLTDRLSVAEATIDSLERQLAAIAVGFGEVSSIANALVDQLGGDPDEVRLNFAADLQRHRAEFMNTLRGTVDTMGDEDPDFAEAMAGLADKLSPDTE